SNLQNPTTGRWNYNELQETLLLSSYSHVEKGEHADGLKMDVLQAIYYGSALDDLTNALEDFCIHFDDPMPVE
ncbi:5063_t:CDS:2, partial [Dentiscutata erythropus]